MKESESIINDLLVEVDSLTYRLRNIKQCFKSTSNIGLKKRLISENKCIFQRIKEINNIAIFLNKSSIEKITFNSLLLEKSKRTLFEATTESNLFFY